jgi:glycosyltransferase involved in cell wall biosynthesis
MAGPEKTKVLFIVQHRFNRSPGQRYRCEQYISYLENNGFECVYSPLITTKEEDNALYNSSSLFDKAAIFLKGFWRRLKDVRRARNFDIIFIYREAFMTGSVFFERLLKKSGARVILDFDDAIWLSTVSEVNRSLQWLKRPGKVNDIIALSNLVITGNSYLADYAKTYNKNVTIFPSTIDLDYYRIPDKPKTSEIITIGWSGSHTTIEHFETIVPVLKNLKNKFGPLIKFEVYGDANYKNAALEIQGTAWSFDSEVSTIAAFDIGIMPLPDDNWSKGKCAMKGLQYMGLQVPAVLAAVGMNKDVINDGLNGFLANNEDEWLVKLSLLIENPGLREQIGKAGRKTIEQRFSSQGLRGHYLDIFRIVLTGGTIK